MAEDVLTTGALLRAMESVPTVPKWIRMLCEARRPVEVRANSFVERNEAYVMDLAGTVVRGEAGPGGTLVICHADREEELQDLVAEILSFRTPDPEPSE